MAAANCAMPPTASAGQYATSNICNNKTIRIITVSERSMDGKLTVLKEDQKTRSGLIIDKIKQ